MAVFDFPASPTVGQIYTPAGGPSYIWNGTVWTVTTGPVAVTLRAARNRIVNGAMLISQENGDTGSALSNYYVADQWVSGWSPGAAAVGAGRVAGPTPNGSQRVIQTNVNTTSASVGAANYWIMAQPIEGTRIADFQWGTANAKPAVLRFWLKGPAGNWCVSLTNAAQTRCWLGNVVIAAGQANAWVEHSMAIPGETTGVWPTGAVVGGYLQLTFACGTNYHGTAGWNSGALKLATATITNGFAAGNAFFFGDVGLYLDDQNTGIAPRWEMPDEAEELRACKRYFRTYGGDSVYEVVSSGQAYIPTGVSAPVRFDPPMRVAPALSSVGAWAQINSGGALLPVTSMSVSMAGPNSMTIGTVCAGGGLVAGDNSLLLANNDLTARMRFNARM